VVHAGDPNLPENDAGLDTEHWTGTTGCVILAPHLRKSTKKDVGLPHVSEATEKQKETGMCWTEPDELYNRGKPFKITCRDARGIMVTILADNYFGEYRLESAPLSVILMNLNHFFLFIMINRVLQERSKDSNRIVRQRVWIGRGGACWRRTCIQND
jgi:hypothetical protein